MDKSGVRLSLFASHLALESPRYAAYDLEAARTYPDRFRCCRVAHPRYADVCHDFAAMEQNEDWYVGFKFHPDNHATPMSASVYVPYWAYAHKHKLLCLSHTWGESPHDGPNEARKILERYPDVTLIAGHSFHEDWELACELAIEFPNLYLELTAVMDNRGVLEMFCECVGSERILFGADMPWFSYAYYIGAVCAADITDDDRRNIFYRNGVKLLSRFAWFESLKPIYDIERNAAAIFASVTVSNVIKTTEYAGQ